jgi:hypothetical protein
MGVIPDHTIIIIIIHHIPMDIIIPLYINIFLLFSKNNIDVYKKSILFINWC